MSLSIRASQALARPSKHRAFARQCARNRRARVWCWLIHARPDSNRAHADRRPRVPRGRAAAGGRARRAARLPGDPDLQPVAAHVAAARPTATRTSPRSARRMAASSPIDAVLIHAVYLLNCASEDADIRAKSLASLTHSLRGGAAIGAAGVVLHPGSAKTGDVGAGDRARGRDDRRGARRERGLRAAPREHRRRRRDARALVRRARRAARAAGGRRAARRVPGLLPPARLRL